MTGNMDSLDLLSNHVTGASYSKIGPNQNVDLTVHCYIGFADSLDLLIFLNDSSELI